MSITQNASPRRLAAVAASVALALTGLAVPVSAVAATGADVIINEAYLKGGSSGAPYTNKFIELYNAGDSAQSLDGWSLQYRSASGTGAPSSVVKLSGTIEPGDYFLVQGGSNGSNGAALPDADLLTSFNPGGQNGVVWLADVDTAVTLSTGSITGNDDIVDLLGYGSANTYETAVGPDGGGNSTANALVRTDHVDTDDNSADFSVTTTVTPQASGGAEPEPTPTPTETSPEPTASPTGEPSPTPTASALPISEIQGTSDASPLVGQTVTTTGVVTAAYPTGGYNGFYIQTPGTGGAIDLGTHDASSAIFVYGSAATAKVEIGDEVQVTGAVSEYNGTTEISASADGVTVLSDSGATITPADVVVPATESQRESLEGMLLAPAGDYTVTNTYTTNQYAEIGLAVGETPILVPTEVGAPGTDEYAAAVADAAARAVTLDDGASINFLNNANKAIPLPYLTDTTVTVGADVTFTQPVVFEFRNSVWKLQPTEQLVAGGALPAQFSDVRTAAPDAVGGDIQLASFNVLNYFTTTGEDAGCSSFYTDRAGNPVTVNSCGNDGPRGAANDENLQRQQAKIVEAINGLNAEVVSLEEIENSAKFGQDRDAALAALVDALNADLGSDDWSYVPSPAAEALPDLSAQDVIRTAFIYKNAVVAPIGDSVVLTDSDAFANARQPLAQAFAAPGEDEAQFVAIVNHFKSKSSSGANGDNADQGDGQGAYNADRVRQAQALIDFADEVSTDAGTENVFLLGDFNAYSKEDPAREILAAGYTDLGARSGEYSYSFSGQSGSLDHIFASEAALSMVTGEDIWNINSGESIALEYSRYNYNATDFYEVSPYRSSDHDPIVVGIDLVDPNAPIELNLLNINDFHGRIDGNTVEFAGTIEQLRAAHGEANTLFLSAGDNIGASLFASSLFQDKPTIDVLNALDLAASAVGNHEFDKGLGDLQGRVSEAADFPYLGANVYEKGTQTPVFDEYALFDVDGVTVAVVGAVTEETPSLVSPGGISTIDFGDPVEAVNRVAAQLSDGNAENGEADVIVAEYHEGSVDGVKEGATIEEEIAAGGAFARIVTETSAEVDVIFTGHTHKEYAWDGPIPGESGTRPVLQTGSYGENIGQVTLDVDPNSGEVLSYESRNVKRTTDSETDLVNTFPRVAEVKTIVDDALAQSAVVGAEPVGSVSADITTAFAGGSYVDGVWTGGTRDNRMAQSTLGNLVADSLVASLSPAERGGAQIGLVNPGGLRADLRYGDDGVITYSEANAVLPFVNNLWTTTLTGAQFKAVLEQQWQPEGASRPYLQLGVSENVFYTYDASRAKGDRITGIWIDGQPIVMDAEYRVGSFSFLLQGGDNFTVLAEGTDTRDSGLIDRDAWIEYLKNNKPVAPDFASRSAQVTGVPASVERGETISLHVSGRNLTSLGAPEISKVDVGMSGTESVVQTYDVVGADETIEIVVPDDVEHESALNIIFDGVHSFSIPFVVTDGIVHVNLVNINDFHGRIDDKTLKFAGTVAELLRPFDEENSLFLSAGDNIGASLFASANAQDKPTIDVLNALGLDASAVGNHEFDRGFGDLRDRVVPASEFPYLGANVYEKGTETPALDEYALFDVDGVTVAVVGAVTEETPSLVSPGGISTIDFGDPVEAVNRVAAQLSDGNAENGEADVIVAEYHEGSVDGVKEGATIEEEIAAGGAFARIVTETSAEVDVIFTGHTHKEYAWDGPIPGESGTRPVLQTGSYGENIGQVHLKVNAETGEVEAYTAQNAKRTTTSDENLLIEFPQLAEVKSIVDAALADAAEVGNEPVGSVSADITTAFAGGSYVDGVWTGGTRDNRMAQSTLGNLVADSLVASLSDPLRGGAQIGLVNPGGLRADLRYGDDGVITYSEANAVLPFVNNLWTTTLTGAQFKATLEQQWQPEGASRPYLQLGVSENVFYTYDASRAKGDRITGIWIDGQPIVMDAEYRVGSFSFLLQGGDNFTVLAEGTDTRDSGLIDRDAWIEYLDKNEALAPDFASRSAQITGLADSIERGTTTTFTVSGLNLTSLGSPENTTALVSFAGNTAVFDPVPIVNGTASVELTVPADAADMSEIIVNVEPTGTTVRAAVTVTGEVTTEPTPSPTPTLGETDGGSNPPAEGALTPEKQGAIAPQGGTTFEQGQTVTITVGAQYAGQTVEGWLFSTPTYLGTAVVSAAGTATFTVPAGMPVGTHRLVVTDSAGAVIGWVYVEVTELAATGGTAESIAVLPWAASAMLLAGLAVLVIRRRTARQEA